LAGTAAQTVAVPFAAVAAQTLALTVAAACAQTESPPVRLAAASQTECSEPEFHSSPRTPPDAEAFDPLLCPADAASNGVYARGWRRGAITDSAASAEGHAPHLPAQRSGSPAKPRRLVDQATPMTADGEDFSSSDDDAGGNAPDTAPVASPQPPPSVRSALRACAAASVAAATELRDSRSALSALRASLGEPTPASPIAPVALRFEGSFAPDYGSTSAARAAVAAAASAARRRAAEREVASSDESLHTPRAVASRARKGLWAGHGEATARVDAAAATLLAARAQAEVASAALAARGL